ncbi:MAG: hypothetical protein KBT12_09260 [Bacteroidales bacterium]|nr:hypothetical protein [Candidatus Physcousia equi]
MTLLSLPVEAVQPRPVAAVRKESDNKQKPHQTSQPSLFSLIPITDRHHVEQQRKLASSTFPVTVWVKGRSLCVKSDYNQLLPIYTRGGTFYLAMRLNKGVNWLNGLPRGQYLINHQSIVIP